MSKVVGAFSLSLVLASAGIAAAQEIGKVAALPNADTYQVTAQFTEVRSPGETVYIVRGGNLVTDAQVVSFTNGDAVLELPAQSVNDIREGDQILLTNPVATEAVVAPAELGAPEPPVSTVSTISESLEVTEQLEKNSSVVTTQRHVSTAIARPTPRGMGVPVFPAPATVSTQAGIVAPYGQGLAAAAPVGTPYLRSPAFAGPPIIYMPQTVTRVLLPGATPYPSNIMSPPTAYTYASAPFLRTDIYTSLPYGTFYWPQGYAGTTPVEPQVPAYVTAPASAILSTEADYAAGRYDPAVAHEETLNPITAGINASLISTTGFSSEQSGTAAAVSTVAGQQSAASLTVTRPGLEANPSAEAAFPPLAPTPAPVDPFPVLSDGSQSVSVTTPAALPDLAAAAVSATPAPVAPTPALPTLPDASAAPAPGLPTLPGASATPAPAPGLPTLPGAATPAPQLPSLPDVSAAQPQSAPGLPELPAQDNTVAAATGTPAVAMQPSLPQPATGTATLASITVDDSTPGGLVLSPPEGWTPSASSEGQGGGSVIAQVDPDQVKTATFQTNIPADGLYEVALSFVGAAQFRSNAVPVTINTATGEQQTTIDQTQTAEWHVLGNYQLKEGVNVPVVTISTAGLEGAGSNVSVSVDALRLRPIQ